MAGAYEDAGLTAHGPVPPPSEASLTTARPNGTNLGFDAAWVFVIPVTSGAPGE